MKKSALTAVTAGVIAVAAVLAPALSASAAPAHAASKSYTLSVTGNGKHATVVWTTITVPKGTTSVPTPVVHAVPKAHEPWTKHVKPGYDVYEIAAVQTTGTVLRCTVKNTHGTVIASSYSHGKNTVVTCIVAKDALLTGVGGGSGSSGGSGSGYGGSLLSALR